MRNKTWAPATILALVLSACGGGSGSGDAGNAVNQPAEVPQAVITEGNYIETGRALMTVFNSTNSNPGLSSVAAVKDEQAAPAAQSDAIGTGLLALPRLTNQVYAAAAARRSRFERPQLATEQVSACRYGGDMKVQITDVDGNNVFGQGDTATVTSTNCVLQPGAAETNGQITYTALADATDSASFLSNVQVEYKNFSQGDITYNGQITLKAGTDADTLTMVTYKGLAVKRSGEDYLLNLEFVAKGVSSAPEIFAQGSIVWRNQSYGISTPTALAAGTTHLNAGVIQIAGAIGEHIDVTLHEDTLDLAFFGANATTSSATSTITWAER